MDEHYTHGRITILHAKVSQISDLMSGRQGMSRNACAAESTVDEKDASLRQSLLQAYISRARIESFSLIADLNYVSQNAPRICRALFEICLRRGWSSLAEQLLTFSKASPPSLQAFALSMLVLAFATLKRPSWPYPSTKHTTEKVEGFKE